MGRPKKHIAIQNEFGFVPEITKPTQEVAPHNLKLEKSLKETIEILNSSKSMTENPIINEKLAQELQLPTTNYTQVVGAVNPPSQITTSCIPSTMFPYVGDPPGSCGSLSSNIGPNTTENGNVLGISGGAYIPANPKATPPKQLARNQYGLYNHINYIFNDEGFVNWRAMIPVRYLYVGDNIKENPMKRELFEKKYGKKPEKIDLAIDKIEDKDLLITLAGIRYLAALRGYDSVEFKTVESSNQNQVIVECIITWFVNYETKFNNDAKDYFDTTRYSAVANASTDNTNGVFKTYLPEIASNRAFCRAVRNFLNIDVVSDEEAFEKKDEPKAAASNGVTPYGNPHELLKAKLEEKGYTFAKLKDSMVKKDKEWEKYEAIVEIPHIKVFDVLGRLKQKEEKEKNPVPE